MFFLKSLGADLPRGFRRRRAAGRRAGLPGAPREVLLHVARELLDVLVLEPVPPHEGRDHLRRRHETEGSVDER